jgi:hypothetical protein
LNWFWKFSNRLNLELSLRFSSACVLNLDLNLGSVRLGSGSNLGSELNCGNTRWEEAAWLGDLLAFLDDDEGGDTVNTVIFLHHRAVMTIEK